MKNLKLFKRVSLLALTVLLATSVFITPVHAEAESVSVYLVLGRGGTLGGSAGESVASLFLENAILFEGEAGSTLPTPERGTAVFDGWAYATGGAVVKVDKLSSNMYKHQGDSHPILYAQWKGVGGSVVNPPLPAAIRFAGVNLTESYSTMFQTAEYSGRVTLTAGESYTITSTADGAEGESYPRPTGAKPNAGFTFGRDTSAKVNTDDYVEGMPENSVGIKAQGVNADKDYYLEFNSGAGNCYLKAKQSGTFTVYICIFDNGGWVRIFLQPVA